MAEVNADSYRELEEYFGADKLRELIEDELKAHLLMQRESGDRAIEQYWDYRDLDAFENSISSILLNDNWYFDTKYSVPMTSNPTTEAIKAEPRRYRDLSLMDFHSSMELFDFIAAKYRDENWDWVCEAEHYEFDTITKGVKYAIEVAVEARGDTFVGDLDNIDWTMHLQEDFGIYFDDMIESNLEHASMKVNCQFSCGDEWNSDYTNIPNVWDQVFREGLEGDGALALNEYDKEMLDNNSLTWLLETQCCSWEDLVDVYTHPDPADNSKKTAFLKSVIAEFENNPSHMSALTMCVEMPFSEYAQLVCGEKNFEVDPSKQYFTIGLFDKWSGGGSLLEITPSESFVIGREVLNSAKPDFVRYGRNDYGSIADCYGVGGELWTSCLTPTDKEVIPTPDVDPKSLEKALNENNRDRLEKFAKGMAIEEAIKEFGGIDALREAMKEVKSTGKDKIAQRVEPMRVEFVPTHDRAPQQSKPAR